MPDTIFAQQGDTLDGLLWRESALDASNLAPVLALNAGLAALGAVLPAGTAVTLPVTAPARAERAIVQLWD